MITLMPMLMPRLFVTTDFFRQIIFAIAFAMPLIILRHDDIDADAIISLLPLFSRCHAMLLSPCCHDFVSLTPFLHYAIFLRHFAFADAYFRLPLPLIDASIFRCAIILRCHYFTPLPLPLCHC
jgi:hypothetical protein